MWLFCKWNWKFHWNERELVIVPFGKKVLYDMRWWVSFSALLQTINSRSDRLSFSSVPKFLSIHISFFSFLFLTIPTFCLFFGWIYSMGNRLNRFIWWALFVFRNGEGNLDTREEEDGFGANFKCIWCTFFSLFLAFECMKRFWGFPLFLAFVNLCVLFFERW